jgi:hypothetical protein
MNGDLNGHAEPEDMPIQEPEPINSPAADELPENRQERLAILLANLENEDVVHVKRQRIPAFLRIDKDVTSQRDKLM